MFVRDSKCSGGWICLFFLQEAHVNTCYKHFYYFISEFDLVAQKELEPLKEMTARICHESEPDEE